jgi:hypothetical protein
VTVTLAPRDPAYTAIGGGLAVSMIGKIIADSRDGRRHGTFQAFSHAGLGDAQQLSLQM